MHPCEFALTEQCVATIIEALQGPSRPNQDYVAASTCMDSIQNILAAQHLARIETEEDILGAYALKLQGMLCVQAVLELRHDDIVRKTAGLIDPGLLLGYSASLRVKMDDTDPELVESMTMSVMKDERYAETAKRIASGHGSGEDGADPFGTPDEAADEAVLEGADEEPPFTERLRDCLDESVVATMTVISQLRSHYDPEEIAVLEEETSKDNADDGDPAEVEAMIDAKVGQLYIIVDNRMELVRFQRPEEMQSLRESSKRNFLAGVDVTSPETRLKGLLEVAVLFAEESRWLHQLKDNPFFAFLNTFYPVLAALSFLLAVLLTLHAVFHMFDTKEMIATAKATGYMLGLSLNAVSGLQLAFWILSDLALSVSKVNREADERVGKWLWVCRGGRVCVGPVVSEEPAPPRCPPPR
jgi:hypothetical protein